MLNSNLTKKNYEKRPKKTEIQRALGSASELSIHGFPREVDSSTARIFADSQPTTTSSINNNKQTLTPTNNTHPKTTPPSPRDHRSRLPTLHPPPPLANIIILPRRQTTDHQTTPLNIVRQPTTAEPLQADLQLATPYADWKQRPQRTQTTEDH